VTCNGASGVIIAATSCQVPLTTLTTSPYSLSLGATIDVKLVTYNFYGDSAFSSVGSGANIVGLPDAPVSLQNDPSVTSALIIGLLWEDGASDNGKPIEDYMIEYDQSTGVWTQLASGILQTSYETVIGLAPGSTYAFKVYTRNSVGFSLSAAISILAAQEPDAPTTPSTEISSGTNLLV
jgi:hypothetical protein